jgi:hypothetical protein
LLRMAKDGPGIRIIFECVESDKDNDENDAIVQHSPPNPWPETKRRKSILSVKNIFDSNPVDFTRRKSVSFSENVDSNTLVAKVFARRRSSSYKDGIQTLVDTDKDKQETPSPSVLLEKTVSTFDKLQLAELKGTSAEIVNFVLNNAIKIILMDMKSH